MIGLSFRKDSSLAIPCTHRNPQRDFACRTFAQQSLLIRRLPSNLPLIAGNANNHFSYSRTPFEIPINCKGFAVWYLENLKILQKFSEQIRSDEKRCFIWKWSAFENDFIRPLLRSLEFQTGHQSLKSKRCSCFRFSMNSIAGTTKL